MMETLCCTIKRVAPAMLTPPVKACLIDERTANKIKATTIDNRVRIVRTFFRLRLLQINTKNFIKSDQQHPNSNIQHSEKLQDSNPKRRIVFAAQHMRGNDRRGTPGIEIWGLELL